MVNNRRMTKDEQIKARAKEEIARRKEAKTWQKKCDKLKKRKDDPLTEQEFCKRHGISYTRFSRNKGDKSTPTAEKVAQVRAAFEAEGV